MKKKEDFYTLKGYQLAEEITLTNAMEDYLEMFCRIVKEDNRVRVKELASRLNVKPSSASKMLQQMSRLGYLNAEPYGEITLTESGKDLGEYLLYRHDVINEFLCTLNDSNNELEETEKIEHFLSRNTVSNIANLLEKLKNK